jgi:hypothetical protein
MDSSIFKYLKKRFWITVKIGTVHPTIIYALIKYKTKLPWGSPPPSLYRIPTAGFFTDLANLYVLFLGSFFD